MGGKSPKVRKNRENLQLFFLICSCFCKVWFPKCGCSSLVLRQLQLSCGCLVLTLKSKVQSYEAQAVVFVNAAEVFFTRCWRTRISSKPYQKGRSVLNFCVNPFAVRWNRWSLHFRECVFRARVSRTRLTEIFIFLLSQPSPDSTIFPQKRKEKPPNFGKSFFISFCHFFSLFLG